MISSTHRLIVVSNRLPFVLTRRSDKTSRLEPASGGLVTALAPVLRDRGGVWIGWPGQAVDIPELPGLLEDASDLAGYQFVPVALTAEEHENYYNGYANESLWPLFHDLQSQCRFHPDYWKAYATVNGHFAGAILEQACAGDFVWVHDYHLMGVADILRKCGRDNPLAFFLHVPFPPLDIFIKLPERHKLLGMLLHYDLIGLQTQRDRRNFIHCVRALAPGAHISHRGNLHTIRLGERQVNVGAFPIGIDFKGFADHTASEEVATRAWHIHENFPERQIVFGLDRLDYTKGIPHRLEAFRNLLKRYPELHERINLVQVVVPSRVGIPKYDALKREIERLVGEINGQFTRSGWIPVHYIFRSLERTELLAWYRTAEIALVTPLKDGMNLVSKEFCASSIEENAVLILSQFAGAAAQLKRGALLVNPYDVEQTADAIRQAFYMPPEERRARMRQMRRNVRHQDIYWWVDYFIESAIGKELKDFPIQEEYIPENLQPLDSAAPAALEPIDTH
ncbi:trehalose-6-phosphate synthase [bacterium]|nr:trehalose-6-phosphate synthase [bacterium]